MTATSRAGGDTASGASGAKGASDNDLRSEVGRFQSLGAAAASEPAVAHDLARFAAAFLAALEAGAIRAAEPDAGAQGGWRVNAWVKQGILLCFRVPGLRDWRGPIFAARDRQAFGVLDLLDSTGAREAAADGAPWRVVPGGTTVRSGAHLEPGVTIMPPAYVNVGAWVGRGTMVDSHALVGSCAQVGRRVHLSAAAQVGGVLEPVGARPVVVEDDAFVGGGCGLYDGVVVGSGAVLAAGVILTGTSRLVDLVAETEHVGSAEAPLVVPPGSVVVPGSRPAAGSYARTNGISVNTAVVVKRRDPSTDARVALEGALRVIDVDDRLAIGVGENVAGLEPEALAALAGTPFYAYDFDVIERRLSALRDVLPASMEVAYATKANPSLAVVAHLAGLGAAGDIASAGELELIHRAGMDPARVVFTGPGKTEAEHRAAIAAGIRAVTVESPGELGRLERVAAEMGARVPILLRRAVGERARHESVRIIGDAGAGKFGMGSSDLRATAQIAARSPHLDLLGVHAFGASNLRDADALVEHVADTVAFAADVMAIVGLPLRLVDAGGGLGIPYADTDEPLDLDRLGSGLRAAAERWSADPRLAELRVLLEPGRFLVGPAGVYVTRVVDVKELDGRTVAIVDGGIHHVLRPTLVRQPHRLIRLGQSEAGLHLDGIAAVAGPLCTGLDILSPAAQVGAVTPGDLLAVLDVGAYGFTELMPLFLSRTFPAEIAVRDGRAAVVRAPIEPRHFLDLQRLPDW